MVTVESFAPGALMWCHFLIIPATLDDVQPYLLLFEKEPAPLENSEKRRTVSCQLLCGTTANATIMHGGFAVMRDHWDEKGKRLLAASMALSLEAGSHTAIHQVTGMALNTLQVGVFS